jgi:hypothetical protein
MIITLISGLLLGVVIGTFLEEIIDWAKKFVENDLPIIIKKAFVYLKRLPGAIIRFIRYIKDGKMMEKEGGEHEVSLEELERMYREGHITREEFEQLSAGKKTHYADIERAA